MLAVPHPTSLADSFTRAATGCLRSGSRQEPTAIEYRVTPDPLALLLITGREPCAHRLALYLTSQGVRVTTVGDQVASQLDGEAHGYDCIVVDLGSRRSSCAVTLTRTLRGQSDVPIVLISAESGVSERVAALDAGADDCVTASCSDRELLSRILASVRRVRRLR